MWVKKLEGKENEAQYHCKDEENGGVENKRGNWKIQRKVER